MDYVIWTGGTNPLTGEPEPDTRTAVEKADDELRYPKMCWCDDPSCRHIHPTRNRSNQGRA